MAQVSIHQDLCGYERKRWGLTTRQLVCVCMAAVLAFGVGTVCLYALKLPVSVGVSVGLCIAAIPIACGFAPIWGMPAEEWFMRLEESRERGNAVPWEGEYVRNLEGETTREHKKLASKRGAEAQLQSGRR